MGAPPPSIPGRAKTAWLWLATALVSLLLTLLALLAALAAYAHYCRARGRNVGPRALRSHPLVRAVFERRAYRDLIAVVERSEGDRFPTTWDLDDAVALQRSQFEPVAMYGEQKYRYRPNIRSVDFIVWTGLMRVGFAMLETPELDAAIERCEVLHRVSFETDALGFKKTEFPPEPGTPSVLFLGDSFTEGLHVRSEDTFASLYGRLMRQAGLRATPVNGGVNGYGTLEEAWTAENFAPRLGTKLVIENLFLNDAGNERAVLRGRAPPDQLARMFRDLDRLEAFCRQNVLPLVVSVIPAKQQLGATAEGFQEQVRGWCARRGVPFLNPRRHLEQHGGVRNYFDWDPHLNEDGHRAYAAFLFEHTRSLLEARLGGSHGPG